MTPFQVFIGGMIFLGLIIFFVIYSYWKRIHSFLKPHLYAEITMLESDNNVRTWLQRKSSDLGFKFNEGRYYMFDSKEQGFTSIYRTGRLSKLFYVEGNENPIDFRKIESTGNPQLNVQQEKVNTGRLWIGNKGVFGDLWEQYGGILTIGGIILIIFILLR